ncbi:AEC family transporter [Limibaculum sp. FT325]|uniref:AEC family transporter n=1 Tax=Thermohalobaculum sediminis TaxID=2939436 RepID=UPI0020C0CBE1|nr:AEC family transporter [Limibaculum sediminis]MCL5778997.1 AEC family transporter [Limibaculum sediminis]
MHALLSLFLIVLPVFLVVGAGYAAVRSKIFPDAGIDALVRFATGIAVPVLLFRAIYRLDLGAVLVLAHLASFYIGSLAAFVCGIVLSRRIWGRRPGESVAVGFSAFFSNTVLLGVPVMTRAYGEEALAPAFAIIAFHAPFGYLVGILTMEFSRRDGAPVSLALRRTARAMFHNELTLGIALGFVLNLTGVPLPEPVTATINMIAAAALPVALFALGGVLTRYRLRAELGEAGMTAALSLMLHPFIAFVLSRHVFGLPDEFVRAAVVIAAMPTGVNGYVFAAMYDRAVGTAASTVLLGTAASIVTITLWLAILGGGAL